MGKTFVGLKNYLTKEKKWVKNILVSNKFSGHKFIFGQKNFLGKKCYDEKIWVIKFFFEGYKQYLDQKNLDNKNIGSTIF